MYWEEWQGLSFLSRHLRYRTPPSALLLFHTNIYIYIFTIFFNSPPSLFSIYFTIICRLDAVEKGKTAALEKASKEATRAETEARERFSRSEAEHALALKENGKAAVRQRALERELSRIKTRYRWALSLVFRGHRFRHLLNLVI